MLRQKTRPLSWFMYLLDGRLVLVRGDGADLRGSAPPRPALRRSAGSLAKAELGHGTQISRLPVARACTSTSSVLCHPSATLLIQTALEQCFCFLGDNTPPCHVLLRHGLSAVAASSSASRTKADNMATLCAIAAIEEATHRHRRHRRDTRAGAISSRSRYSSAVNETRTTR